MNLRKQHLPETMSQDEMKVPEWLINTIYRCLEKSPGERFRNGMELHAHIRTNNTSTGHPKDWGAEQLTILQQQNEKLLKQIANETGGKYFRAKDNEGLINIYSEIDKLEKSRIEVTAMRRYTEKFFPFAIAAAVLIFLEWFLRMTTFRKFP